jgi:glycosyltransferase involved in cell wall biosynthesis
MTEKESNLDSNHVPVSIIIPTFNRAGQIRNIIEALKKQSVRNFEIIIVNDGSTDNTNSTLEELLSIQNEIKVVEQVNKGRASSRNLGARNAKGDLLVFYDDDVRPVADSISKHIECQEKFPDSICGGNQIEDKNLIQSDIQQFKHYLSTK